MIRKQETKKGLMGGLQTVGAVIIAFLVLAVIAIAAFLALNSLNNSNILSQTQTVGLDGSQKFINNSFKLNATATAPANISALPASATDISYNGLLVVNATGGETINPGNFTVDSLGRFINSTNGQYGNQTINVSVNYYTYKMPSNALNVINNVSYGTVNFFTNIPTIFTILGAVIVVLAVALILYAVSRFAGGAERETSGGYEESSGPGL